jgi:hypothetical protein
MLEAERFMVRSSRFVEGVVVCDLVGDAARRLGAQPARVPCGCLAGSAFEGNLFFSASLWFYEPQGLQRFEADLSVRISGGCQREKLSGFLQLGRCKDWAGSDVPWCWLWFRMWRIFRRKCDSAGLAHRYRLRWLKRSVGSQGSAPAPQPPLGNGKLRLQVARQRHFFCLAHKVDGPRNKPGFCLPVGV